MKKGYALVLSGGGAKGAYQIGAWKALIKNNLSITAVSGASVGALNAALIAQGDEETADKLWEKIRIDSVINIPSELVSNGRLKITARAFTDLKLLTSSWRNGLLLDSSPLKKLINNTLDEDLVRKRGIDLGLVTINRSTIRPVEIFIDSIEKGLLADYLFASASFPAFRSAEIKGEKYIDGGLHDNIPYAMLKNRGYRRFIVIDISGPGNNRKPDITGTETIYIKNSLELGGVLDFDGKNLKRSSLLGFLDTDRIFGGNEGIKYFFKPDKVLEKRFKTLLDRPSVKLFIDMLQDKENGGLRGILPSEYREWRYPVFSLIECAALSLGIERVELYEFGELVDLIRNEHERIETRFSSDGKDKPIKNINRIISEIKGGRTLTEYPPFVYYKGAELFSGSSRITIEKKSLFMIFPCLKGALVFFKVLSEW